MYSIGKFSQTKRPAKVSLKKIRLIVTMYNGDFVSPAPRKAPPKANSKAIKGCIIPKSQTNKTVKRMTSGSSTKKLAIGRDDKAKTIPKIPMETLVSPAERHPLLLASLGFSIFAFVVSVILTLTASILLYTTGKNSEVKASFTSGLGKKSNALLAGYRDDLDEDK